MARLDDRDAARLARDVPDALLLPVAEGERDHGLQQLLRHLDLLFRLSAPHQPRVLHQVPVPQELVVVQARRLQVQRVGPPAQLYLLLVSQLLVLPELVALEFACCEVLF